MGKDDDDVDVPQIHLFYITRNLSDLLINSNTCLNIFTFCSYERFGLPDV